MMCVNKKGIFAIVGVAIIIIVVFAVPKPTETSPPMIQDLAEINDEAKVGVSNEPISPQISDEGSIEASLNVIETPAISDTGEVEVEAEGGYYFDENGTKHYVIEVGDTPTLN